jgi:hypothetical protein
VLLVGAALAGLPLAHLESRAADQLGVLGASYQTGAQPASTHAAATPAASAGAANPAGRPATRRPAGSATPASIASAAGSDRADGSGADGSGADGSGTPGAGADDHLGVAGAIPGPAAGSGGAAAAGTAAGAHSGGSAAAGAGTAGAPTADAASAGCPAPGLDPATLVAIGADAVPSVAGLDVLAVQGRVTGGEGRQATAYVALWDPAGLPVTMSSGRVTLPESDGGILLGGLDGRAIGEDGSSGRYRVSVVLVPAGAGCAPTELVSASTDEIRAADFAGWTATVPRLRARLDGYRATGGLSGSRADELAGLLPAAAAGGQLTSPAALDAFRVRLGSMIAAGDLGADAARVLRGLADRLVAQASG